MGMLSLAIPVAFVRILGINVMAYALAVILRKWARKAAAIFSKLSTFDLEECLCAVEADRAVIHRNIASIMRTTGSSHAEASEAEALATFNVHIKERLSKSLSSSIGHSGLDFKCCLCLSLVLGAQHLSAHVAELTQCEEGCWAKLSEVLNAVASLTCMAPMVLSGMACWVRWCLGLSGCAERIFLVGLVLLTGTCFFIYGQVMARLEAWAVATPIALLANVSFILALVLATFVVFVGTSRGCRAGAGRQVPRTGFPGSSATQGTPMKSSVTTAGGAAIVKKRVRGDEQGQQEEEEEVWSTQI